MNNAKKAAIPVLKGDVWRDKDPRSGGRQVRVEVAAAPMGQVACRDVATGRLTRISKARMEKGQGWELVSRKEVSHG